jgi:uracil-DNA glycosylase
LRPRLLLPVGKLAIAQLMPVPRLNDVIGQQWTYRSSEGWEADVIPLPHPSGASTWFKMEPGRTLLAQALDLIAAHPAWHAVLDAKPDQAAGT